MHWFYVVFSPTSVTNAFVQTSKCTQQLLLWVFSFKGKVNITKLKLLITVTFFCYKYLETTYHFSSLYLLISVTCIRTLTSSVDTGRHHQCPGRVGSLDSRRSQVFLRGEGGGEMKDELGNKPNKPAQKSTFDSCKLSVYICPRSPVRRPP